MAERTDLNRRDPSFQSYSERMSKPLSMKMPSMGGGLWQFDFEHGSNAKVAQVITRLLTRMTSRRADICNILRSLEVVPLRICS